MAMKYLGPTLDIHSGGTDLIFPHHENEIAQSEAATGKPFSHFWIHGEHLLVNGQKMSKSLGNFYTLRDLIGRGFKPSAVRYLLASVPYRKQLNFTFEGLEQADQSLERLRNFRRRLTGDKFQAGSNPALAEKAGAALKAFEDGLDDNLNTAEALAAVFELVREGNTAMDRGEFHEEERAAYLGVLEHWNRIFAVLEDEDYAKLRQYGFVGEAAADSTASDTPTNGHRSAALLAGTISEGEIGERVSARERARRSGKYAEADQIRDELLKAGVIIEDTKAGTRWKRK